MGGRGGGSRMSKGGGGSGTNGLVTTKVNLGAGGGGEQYRIKDANGKILAHGKTKKEAMENARKRLDEEAKASKKTKKNSARTSTKPKENGQIQRFRELNKRGSWWPD